MPHAVPHREALASRLLERLTSTLRSLDTRQLTVLRFRIAQTPKATLQAVGQRFGLSKERVRQIQVAVEQRLAAAVAPDVNELATIIDSGLAPAAPAQAVHSALDEATGHTESLAASLLAQALIRALNRTLIRDHYVTRQARQAIERAKALADQLADDVGLIHRDDLLAPLAKANLRSVGDLSALCQLAVPYGFHGSLALRNTQKARTKAALIAINRPATCAEISALTHLDPERTRVQLHNTQSVVRADTQRWALPAWVDHAYSNVSAEIIRHLERNGGSASNDDITREIATRFAAKPGTVRAYLRTPTFQVRDGRVSLAETKTLRLRPLDKIIHGRDDQNRPYWTFTARERHLQGFSVTGVPKEFAHALGARPETALEIKLQAPDACRTLSLTWRLTSLNGASLGRLAPVLSELDVQPGDEIRLTIERPKTLLLRRN